MMRKNLPPGDRTLSPLGVVRQFGRDPLGFLTDQVRRYGDLVTMQGPFYRPNILINDPELIQQVLVTQAAQFQKPPLLKRLFTSTFGDGLFFSEGDFWRRQRKLAQPAFHHQRIKAYGADMVRHTLAMLERWSLGEKLDIDAEMHALTLTIVVDAIFQADVTAETEKIAQALLVVTEVLAEQFSNPLLGFSPDWIPLPALRRKRKAVAILDDIIYRLITERRAEQAKLAARTDLLSLFLAIEDEETGERMSDLQVHDEVMTLFIAGHETTALTLTWALILLSQHPDVEGELWAELDMVLAGRPPTVDDLPHLIYTEYVIKETLRLFPSSPGILREALVPLEIGPLTLEKGDIVWLLPFLIQRDGRYFDQPDRFWPGRFAPDASGKPLERRIPRYAYYPFGGGPRICLGNGFAMLEAQLLLAAILQHYRLQLPADYQAQPKFGPTLGVVGPVSMQIRER